MRVPLDISPVEDARLKEAQVVLGGLAGEMRVFANLAEIGEKPRANGADKSREKCFKHLR